jgi:demethylmenaquinone methyltransferase/2-methoxy-6-polyprenyl-1,4-benzoquinol methylase
LSLKSELWQSVIRAIETAIPDYDFVNEKVSLGLAQKTRNFAVGQLSLENGMLVLDAGIGPGTMSGTILRRNNDLTIVGIDASTVLLRAARDRLRADYEAHVHLVRGAFEALPFRNSSFPRVVSAFAFRDARDRSVAIDEFYRVVTDGGIFGIVDLGKPENRFRRALISIHVRFLVPLISRLSMAHAVSSNPWRMIFPTYRALAKNRELVSHLGEHFTKVNTTQFALGGVIVVLARKE